MAIARNVYDKNQKYIKEKTKTFRIMVTSCDEIAINRYLESQNIGFSTLCRRAIVADMLQHGWDELIGLGRGGDKEHAETDE